MLNKAVFLKKDYSEAYLNLGVCYYKINNLQKSKMTFEKAKELDPEYATAYFNLGIIYEKLNQTTSAIKNYEKYLQLMPYSDKSENVRDWIRKLKGK